MGCTTNSACCKMGGKLASVYRSETDLLLQIPLNASVREYKRLYISAGTRGELCGCCGSERCSWQSCLWCCCRSGPRAEKNPAGDDLNCAGRICSQIYADHLCMRRMSCHFTTSVMIYHRGASVSQQHTDSLICHCTKQDLSRTSRYVDKSSPEIISQVLHTYANS